MKNQANFEPTCTRKNNPTVVVADDNPDNLSSIALLLDALKLEYYLANNGKTALDLVYEKKPNLVLLDLAMPYLNGIEANILIKSDLFTNHISTIAIAEPIELERLEAMNKAGFDEYIVRPFPVEDLEIKIKRLINKKMKTSFLAIARDCFKNK